MAGNVGRGSGVYSRAAVGKGLPGVLPGADQVKAAVRESPAAREIVRSIVRAKPGLLRRLVVLADTRSAERQSLRDGPQNAIWLKQNGRRIPELNRVARNFAIRFNGYGELFSANHRLPAAGAGDAIRHGLGAHAQGGVKHSARVISKV